MILVYMEHLECISNEPCIYRCIPSASSALRLSGLHDHGMIVIYGRIAYFLQRTCRS